MKIGQPLEDMLCDAIGSFPSREAARKRKLRAAAAKAVATKKRMSALTKVRAAEAASKEALRVYCNQHK